MSRHQDLADQIRRSMHDELVAELRLRQRNIVFPYTVRNGGVFLRSLAGSSIHAYPSHRLFAFVYGFFYLLVAASVATVLSLTIGPIDAVTLLIVLVYVLAGLKITVNAAIAEGKPKLTSRKRYPHIKI